VPLWVFALAGIAHMRIDPSLSSNPLDLYDMPYTHSLLGTLAWAALVFTGALVAVQLVLTASPPAFGPTEIALTGLFFYATVAFGAARSEPERDG